jgi:DNA-binding IscR family transcriptional regulator
MNKSLEILLHMTSVMYQLEISLGIRDLSSFEKAILMAAYDLSKRNTDERFKVADLQSHTLTQDISRASFFRSLKRLEDDKLITKLNGRSGYYALNPI